MKVYRFLFVLMVSTAFSIPAYKNVEDYKMLTGGIWTGTLAYLDYTSGQRTLIKANLKVRQSDSDKNVFYRSFLYPDEPGANSTDTIIISRDGMMLGAETIIKRIALGQEIVQMITEKNVMDKGNPKLFRYTYHFSPTRFSITKQEKNIQDTGFLERNTYAFQRN